MNRKETILRRNKPGLQTAIYQVIYGPDRQEGLRKAAGPFFMVIFFIIWGFLFWKCPIGYGNIDESLYLTVPYRLLRWGDGLLAHEWHQTQLFAFPMLPVTMLYNLFFPTTERIILNFRLIYTFLWGCSALFFYHRLKSYSKPGAAIASLSFLIYAPYGIMALSYNSLGILFLLNSGIIGLTAKRCVKAQYVISGIFLAGVILCCPYMLGLYILLTIGALAAFLRKRNKYLQTYWLFATAGAFLVFAVFCAFVFSRASLQDIIRSFPAIMDDPAHSDRSFISKTLLYFSSIWHATPVSPYFIILFTGTCILSRIRKQTAGLCLSVLSLGTIVWLLFALTARKTHINYLMFPICLTGFFCAINSDKKSILHIFYWMWIPGMIYTYCLNYSSNQRLYAITNAATVAAFASIMIIVLYLRKTFSASQIEKMILISSAGLMLAAQVGSELYLRYQIVFWENGVSDQIFYAETGPEKDIRMTERRLTEYNRILAETEPLRTDEEIKRVLFFTRNPVLYLCTEKAFGTYSSWVGINEKNFDKLKLYYKLNPDKVPDGIYLPRDHMEYMIRFEAMGFQPTETADGNFILIRSADQNAAREPQ